MLSSCKTARESWRRAPLSRRRWALRYGADAWGGGSPSEVEVDQNIWVGSGSGQVNTATGDVSYTATDLTVPGPGIPLQFTRTYDAQEAEVQAGGSAVPPLGYGWSDNLNTSLAYVSGIATITEEDGSQVSFVPIAGDGNSWCSGLSTNFCPTAPRVEATLNENSNGTWTFARFTGADDTFTFSSSGALTEIEDPVGDTLTASTYTGNDPSCPSGDTCTAWTSIPAQGATAGQLVLVTDSANQLSEIFVPGASSQQVIYYYSGSGCTWGANTPDLCAIKDVLGNTTSYTYDGPSFEYYLSSVTPPGGIGYYSNVYNSAGQVTEQTNPVAGDTTTFYYGTATPTPTTTSLTTTTVSVYGTGSTAPDETEYDYADGLLTAVVRGLGTGSPGMASAIRNPTVLLDTSVTDAVGNTVADTYQTGGSPTSAANVVAAVDGVGKEVQAAYGADNQVWCSVDAADYADGTRCPSSPPAAPPSPGTTDPNLGATISLYNAADELTAVTDPLGNTTTYAYTPAGDGVPVGLQYCAVDPVDYQAGLSCPAYGASHVPGTATETYNAAGYVVTSTDADGHTTSYTYSSTNPGLVATTTRPDGTVTSYSYDAAGHALLTTASFGSYSATTQVAYDGAERQFCEVAPAEYAKGVRCPALPITIPTPGSDLYLGATITTYNADSQVTQTTNPLGGITYTAYDDAGQAFCSVAPYEAAEGVTCPSAPPSSPPTVGNDPYLGATITTYNAAGQVVQVTNPLGGITLTSYDAAGNVLETTVESNNPTADPNLVTFYSYDADNRVVQTTVGYGSASPATTEQYYDPNGHVFCSVSANAYAQGSAAFQCPTWQPGWITAPPSPTALYSTTPSASQANNATTAFYSADGDEVQTTDPDIATSVSAFDADGRTYCTADPVNVAAWLQADPSGSYPYVCPKAAPSSPPAQGSNPGYTTTIYDPAGLTLSTTDQLGDTTTYGYDSAGLESSVTDPSGSATTDYCYYYQSGSGNCAASAPAGGGAGSDQYAQVLPSETPSTYTYDAGGAADATSSPAGSTTDSYDALGDLTAETYSNTVSGYSTPANVSYTYYVDGSRETMTDGTGTTTYTYDAMGDVTSQAFSAASGSGLSSNTISYSYFTTGLLASVAYPPYGNYFSSPTVTYTYDALGNMASETDWLGNKVSFAHDGDGNLTAQDNEVSSSYPNGTSGTTYAYDGADLNATATSSLAQTCGGQESLTQSFAGSGGSRNADGEVTEDSETYTGSCSDQGPYERNYSYDLAGQVIYQGSAAQGSSANNFAYSAAGVPTTISSHVSSGGNFDTYNQTPNSAEAVATQKLMPPAGPPRPSATTPSATSRARRARRRRRATAMTRSARWRE